MRTFNNPKGQGKCKAIHYYEWYTTKNYSHWMAIFEYQGNIYLYKVRYNYRTNLNDTSLTDFGETCPENMSKALNTFKNNII